MVGRQDHAHLVVAVLEDMVLLMHGAAPADVGLVEIKGSGIAVLNCSCGCRGVVAKASAEQNMGVSIGGRRQTRRMWGLSSKSAHA